MRGLVSVFVVFLDRDTMKLGLTDSTPSAHPSFSGHYSKLTKEGEFGVVVPRLDTLRNRSCLGANVISARTRVYR